MANKTAGIWIVTFHHVEGEVYLEKAFTSIEKAEKWVTGQKHNILYSRGEFHLERLNIVD